MMFNNATIWSRQTRHPQGLSIVTNSSLCNGNPCIVIWRRKLFETLWQFLSFYKFWKFYFCSVVSKNTFLCVLVCSHIVLEMFLLCFFAWFGLKSNFHMTDFFCCLFGHFVSQIFPHSFKACSCHLTQSKSKA